MSSIRARVAATLSVLLLAGLAGSPASSSDPHPVRQRAALDQADACPRTPARADELVRGCSALQIVGTPGVFYGPVRDPLREVVEMMAHHADLGQASDLVRGGIEGLLMAAHRLGKGKPCPSEQIAQDALARLGEASASIRSAIDARVAAMVGDRRNSTGDVEQAELVIAQYALIEALLSDATVLAHESAAASSAVCAAVAKKTWKGSGVVLKTKDADGWLLLKGQRKRIVGLADKRYPKGAGRGVKVRVVGSRFRDGSILARVVKERAVASKLGTKIRPSCMRLRIAPVQPMAPHHQGPYVDHPTRGYKANGALRLETFMRLAAKQVFVASCPTAKGYGKPIRYQMQIDVEQSGQKETIALDLRDGETPVPLPDWLSGAQPFTIITTISALECVKLGPNVETCGQPKKLGTQKHDAILQGYGSYVSATYASTIFGIVDNGIPGDFEAGTVTGVQLQSPIFLGTSFDPQGFFKAQGYRIVNGVSSKPQVQTILHGQPFAVYEDDFYDPGLLWVEDQITVNGQQHASAIRFAHIEGTRQGKPFWYAAELPRLVRDRIHVCTTSPAFTQAVGDPRPPGDPAIADYAPTYPPKAPYAVPSVKDTFYEMPFLPQHQPGTGLMNIDDANDPARHPEWQAFALDLGAADGEPMLASRGGEVILVQESDPWNWNDPDMPEMWSGIGNYMWIRHDDGTIGVYFHMQHNSLVPHVGDHVARGQQIGKIGNTGNSSGPHVHFEVGGPADVTNDKIRIRFEVEKPSVTGAGWVLDPCYIPRSGEAFRSTNG